MRENPALILSSVGTQESIIENTLFWEQAAYWRDKRQECSWVGLSDRELAALYGALGSNLVPVINRREKMSK